MTEKRFNIEDGYYQGKSRPMIYDDESSDDYYFCGDYEDFKSICEQFNDFDITNKHLKKENKELLELNNNYHTQMIKAEKQAQTIKQQIKEMMNNERTHIGHNVLKQLYEAIQ